MNTLREKLLQLAKNPAFAICDGGQDWWPETLLDFYRQSGESEDILEDDAWIIDRLLITEQNGVIGHIKKGTWDLETDEFKED